MLDLTTQTLKQQRAKTLRLDSNISYVTPLAKLNGENVIEIINRHIQRGCELQRFQFTIDVC